MIDKYQISVSNVSAVLPVTLDEAKAWAVVDHDDHDILLTSMIEGATDDVENELGWALREMDVSFHMTNTKADEAIYDLPYVRSLDSVSDLEVSLIEDGVADELQVLDTNYYLNGSLKIAAAQRSKVTYTVTPVVPQAIKEAIMMLVAYRYNNRGDQEKQHGLPADIEHKINRYRKVWL